VWECGIVLGALLDHWHAGRVPSGSPLLSLPNLRGLRVVELGAGSGIAGLAAAACGAHVTLTDLPPVLPLLRTNAALNAAAIERSGGTADVCACAWEDAHELAAARQGCDLVLAADVLYQRDGAQLDALCAALAALTAPTPERPHGASVLLVHKERHAELDAAVPEAMRARARLALTPVPYAHHHPEYRSTSIKVWLAVRCVDDDSAKPAASKRARRAPKGQFLRDRGF
jgi:predicted nicotinamide N-methyase